MYLSAQVAEHDCVSDQALVMMGGPAGRVPAVREYALRSLQACNPDQVQPPASVLIMEAPFDVMLQSSVKHTDLHGHEKWQCRKVSV